MSNEEQFVVAIELIADKLGIAATEIFSIFVGAQVILGITSILECIIVILLCIITYFTIMKLAYGKYSFGKVIKMREADDRYFGDDDKSFIIFAPVTAALVSVLGWLIVVCTLKYGFIKILCPEYCAIIEIIELVVP